MSLLPTFPAVDDFWPLAGQPADRTPIAAGVRRLANSFGIVLTRLAAWSLERKAMRDLHALDDRLLANIGIERAYIGRAATRGRRARAVRASNRRNLLPG
jgi:uncharacterized protein YjiS (DUF1127 family)